MRAENKIHPFVIYEICIIMSTTCCQTRSPETSDGQPREVAKHKVLWSLFFDMEGFVNLWIWSKTMGLPCHPDIH